jgi:hypothetical protein
VRATTHSSLRTTAQRQALCLMDLWTIAQARTAALPPFTKQGLENGEMLAFAHNSTGTNHNNKVFQIEFEKGEPSRSTRAIRQ